MRKLLFMGICCLGLFGASAAASYFLMGSPKSTKGKLIGTDLQDTQAVSSNSSTSSGNAGFGSPSALGGAGSTSQSTSGDATDNSETPVPFEASGLTTETVLRLSQSLRNRESLLKQREQFAAKQEERVQFAMDDLQREQARLDELKKKIDAQLVKAGQLAEKLTQNAASIESPNQNDETSGGENATTSQAVSEQELKNLKRVAAVLSGMDPQQAAESIRQFANDGKLELAAQILNQFEEKNASEILGSLNDQVLINQLIDQMRKTKPLTK